MAKAVNKKVGVDETPALNNEEVKVEETVMSTNEMIGEVIEETIQSGDVKVIVHDARFGDEPQVMSIISYNLLKEQGIKVEICD